MGLIRLATRRPDRLVASEASSDADLIVRAGRGDEPAFAELVRRYHSAVYRRCRGVFVDAEAAEDATQEAFLRVWLGASSFDPRRGSAPAWLLTVARNAALNVARVRSPTPVEALGDELKSADHSDEVVERFWIEGALARLPDAEHQAIEMSFCEGLSHAQVAAKLGRPLGTVKAQIRRGLLRLAELEEVTP